MRQLGILKGVGLSAVQSWEKGHFKPKEDKKAALMETRDLLEGRYAMPLVQWQKDGKQVVFWPEHFKVGNYVKPAWWKQ